MSMTNPVPSQKIASGDRWSDDRLLDRLMDIAAFGLTNVVLLAMSFWHGFFWGAVAAGLEMTSLMAAFLIMEPIARGYLAERQVRRLLTRLEIPAVHGVFVRAPDGRQAQLDHVAFLGQGIAVLETKSITGVITRTGSRWSQVINGRDRWLRGRSPQQQALDARDVLRDAYPSWRPTSIALTVLTHGEPGAGLQGDVWVVESQHLPMALARFQRVQTAAALRGWTDLERFLRNCRQTRREKWRFFYSVQLLPREFSRQQLCGFGMVMALLGLISMSLCGLFLQDVLVPGIKILITHPFKPSLVHH